MLTHIKRGIVYPLSSRLSLLIRKILPSYTPAKLFGGNVLFADFQEVKIGPQMKFINARRDYTSAQASITVLGRYSPSHLVTGEKERETGWT